MPTWNRKVLFAFLLVTLSLCHLVTRTYAGDGDSFGTCCKGKGCPGLINWNFFDFTNKDCKMTIVNWDYFGYKAVSPPAPVEEAACGTPVEHGPEKCCDVPRRHSGFLINWQFFDCRVRNKECPPTIVNWDYLCNKNQGPTICNCEEMGYFPTQWHPWPGCQSHAGAPATAVPVPAEAAEPLHAPRPVPDDTKTKE